ncbi:putative exo-beta- -glucanase protein [Eutypa lata UCREL1]|uniref:Putative exo-beta--glucanase protein n=1 Tax=Eutypa lata (strain UCR-EL1) TaxID=1287681 RepID=M7SY09_EUTLA|nr:putative exo-beta- -glucanase protein [Eutypa lata UCREL1]
MDTWKSFDELFGINQNYMNQAGSTWDDIGRINVGIRNAAANIGVDERVILSIIMQESHGYVGVETTYSPEGIPTAGIMQCSGCDGYPNRNGLSQDEISSMINGGTQHYKANLQNWGDQWTGESIYPALREYNSGSVNPDNLSDGQGATDSYVSDISQRLGGWAD